ncbi:hypothetical protein B0H11DRAFT_2433281 [Mycena galericulata]|nr:hypothetical protein B0H11DRAFT_2433281 [Mycena galericulata]
MDIDIEREFCSDFKCCDVKLSDLHELFNHLETCHQGGDIFSAPCSGPSSTYGAFSEFFQLPGCPSTSPLPTPKQSKSLFTRIPLQLVPPPSPTVSDSSSASSSSSSSESSSASASSSSESAASSSYSQKQINYPSIQTRDKIYTPVAIPPTLRLDQPQPQAGVVSWAIPAPSSFWAAYPNAMGYGYGYYIPAVNMPHLPPPPQPHAPVPLRPITRAPPPPNVEVIDVDVVASPPSALPHTSSDESAPAQSPSEISEAPPPPPALDAEAAHVRPSSPRPREKTPSTADRRAAGTALVTSLRRRFSSRPIVLPRTGSASSAPDIGGAGGDGMQIDSEVGGDVPEATRGGGDETLEIQNTRTENESQVPHVPKEHDNEPEEREGSTEDANLDSAAPPAEETPDSEPPLLAKPPLYLHGKEKTFVCPVPLCVKRSADFSVPRLTPLQAYLNPGGLRYHARSGTCMMENGKPCAASLAIVKGEMIVCPTAAAEAAASPAGRRVRQSVRLASASAPVSVSGSKKANPKKGKGKEKVTASSARRKRPSSSPAVATTAAAASPGSSYVSDSDSEMSDDDDEDDD